MFISLFNLSLLRGNQLQCQALLSKQAIFLQKKIYNIYNNLILYTHKTKIYEVIEIQSI